VTFRVSGEMKEGVTLRDFSEVTAIGLH
jgi:hypothetical protein